MELALPPGLSGFLEPLRGKVVAQRPMKRPIYRARGMWASGRWPGINGRVLRVNAAIL